MEEEWQKDSLDIRRVIAEYPKHLGACTLRLDFSCIRNPTLKKLIKRYFRVRVGFWEASSFCHALKDMKPFLMALGNAHPEIATFAVLTRDMVEPFLCMGLRPCGEKW